MKKFINTLTKFEIICYAISFIGVAANTVFNIVHGKEDITMNFIALIALGMVIIKTKENEA